VPVTGPARPVDTAPLVDRATALHPTARHVTVEGSAFVLEACDVREGDGAGGDDHGD